MIGLKVHFKVDGVRLFASASRVPTFTPIKRILMQKEGDQAIVQGWVRSKRSFKDFSFVVVNDGSNVNGIQVGHGETCHL